MAYERVNWENAPSTNTPIDAEHLNKMDKGIKEAHEEIEKLGAASNGKSAYELAVENGYDGTVEEWLESLHGEDGITPHIGENGNWFIGETDMGVPAQGTGSSGSSAQADYNQNDSAQADYIKNRPFYGTVTTLFDKDVTTIDDESGYIVYEDPVSIWTGENYTVIYNDVRYSYTLNPETPFFGNNYVFLQQIAAAQGYTAEEYIALMEQYSPAFAAIFVDTGEDFCIVNNASTDTPLESAPTTFYTKQAGTHHFTILTNVIEVDDSYIDLFQADYDQNDNTKPNYIKNRPFYREDLGVVLDQSIEVLEGGSFLDMVLLTSAKEQFGVKYNDEEYLCQAHETSLFGDTLLGLGNRYIFLAYIANSSNVTVEELLKNNPSYEVLNKDTGESFFMLDDMNASTGVSNGTVFLFSEIATGTALNVTIDKIKFRKMDSTFINWVGGVPSTGDSSGGSALPEVTTDDNDKVLMVVDGAWAVGSIADGDEVAY